MTQRRASLGVVAVLALACDTGPIPARRLVPDFPKHRAALVTVSDALLSLHATEDVSGFFVGSDRHVTFVTRDDHAVDTTTVLRAAPDSLKPAVRRIAALAPQVLLAGHIDRDNAVTLETGSGGATGPGWGYVRAGTDGVGRLRQIFQSGLDTIPHENEWFAYSID